MTFLTVNLPDRLSKELSQASQEFLTEILELGLRTRKIEQALMQYAHGKMTIGAAAHFAGITEGEMARYAYAHGLEPRFSDETLFEELS